MDNRTIATPLAARLGSRSAPAPRRQGIAFAAQSSDGLNVSVAGYRSVSTTLVGLLSYIDDARHRVG